jgi:ribose transport system substrate-binding protein
MLSVHSSTTQSSSIPHGAGKYSVSGAADGYLHRSPERRIRQPLTRSRTSDGTSTSNRSVLRACTILHCFQEGQATLGLAEIATETKLSKATVYRMLTTLVDGGMIERRGKNIYAPAARLRHKRTYRLGYASHNDESLFSRMISESICSSAYEAGIELVTFSNRSSATVAVRNAERFAQEGVDLVIEFQTNHESASAVSDRLNYAGIPIIAIEVPHPGALFYGPNNYRAGLLAGYALAQACISRWQASFNELLLLGLPVAGPLVASRLTGLIAGLRERLPGFSDNQIRFIDSRGRFENSLESVRKHLRRTRAGRILVGAINDPSCMGALTAFEEAGRVGECLAVGHNGTLTARRELRRPGSGLIASVGYFPEQYGESVIRLAIDKLQGRQVPPTSFIKHHLLNPENVDRFYPNDSVLRSGESDSLLYSCR